MRLKYFSYYEIYKYISIVSYICAVLSKNMYVFYILTRIKRMLSAYTIFPCIGIEIA